MIDLQEENVVYPYVVDKKIKSKNLFNKKDGLLRNQYYEFLEACSDFFYLENQEEAFKQMKAYMETLNERNGILFHNSALASIC